MMKIIRGLFSRPLVAIGLGILVSPLTLVFASSAASPIGSWDFVLGGRQRGVAQVSFFEDGTLGGVAIYTFGERSLIRTNNGFVFTNRFGAATVEGSWIYDRTNRVSGYMNLIEQDSAGAPNGATNGLSFRGTAKEARLNLLAFGLQGKVNFKGRPLSETNVVDLGGGVSYLGSVRIRNYPFPILEVFNLALESPNIYAAAGGGPGYSYTGLLMISNQRYAAFHQNRGEGSNGPRVATYAGPFYVIKRRASLIGTDGSNTRIRYRITPEVP